MGKDGTIYRRRIGRDEKGWYVKIQGKGEGWYKEDGINELRGWYCAYLCSGTIRYKGMTEKGKRSYKRNG